MASLAEYLVQLCRPPLPLHLGKRSCACSGRGSPEALLSRTGRAFRNGRNPRCAARPGEGWLRVERGAGTSRRLCRKRKRSVASIADGHVCACGLPLCARCSGQCAGRHGDMFTLALHVAFLCQCCDPVFVLGECSVCFRCYRKFLAVRQVFCFVLLSFRVVFGLVSGSGPSCRVCFGMLEISECVENPVRVPGARVSPVCWAADV